MGFFDKVKNMFTEEVEDEVKVEQIKQEVRHIPIKSPNIEIEDEFEEKEIVERFKPEKIEKEKPVFFDDDVFNDLKEEKRVDEEKIELYERPSLYKERDRELKEEKNEEPKFRPTPIISPVYGVLDKNYHKEDIVSRREEKMEHIEEKDDVIDSIRNKAYGTLEDELENTLFGQNSILFKKEEQIEEKEIDSDLLDDLTDDISKELDELLSKKSKHIDKLNKEIKEDILDDLTLETVEENDEIEEIKEDNVEDLIDDDEDLLGFIDATLYSKGEEKDDD